MQLAYDNCTCKSACTGCLASCQFILPRPRLVSDIQGTESVCHRTCSCASRAAAPWLLLRSHATASTSLSRLSCMPDDSTFAMHICIDKCACCSWLGSCTLLLGFGEGNTCLRLTQLSICRAETDSVADIMCVWNW
jgi:hypothetical protein